jgi:hypothetical protein
LLSGHVQVLILWTYDAVQTNRNFFSPNITHRLSIETVADITLIVDNFNRQNVTFPKHMFFVPSTTVRLVVSWNARVNCQKPIHHISVFSLRLFFTVHFSLQVSPSKFTTAKPCLNMVEVPWHFVICTLFRFFLLHGTSL